jgi:hypothetical protein
MTYPTHDTDWALSAKGNWWRRSDGLLLSAGTRKSDGRYWARRGDAFLKGSFNSLSAAQYAAEYGEDGEDYFDDEDAWGTP